MTLLSESRDFEWISPLKLLIQKDNYHLKLVFKNKIFLFGKNLLVGNFI